jgi:membrane-associated protease RseP (regulator of RpoE activity)
MTNKNQELDAELVEAAVEEPVVIAEPVGLVEEPVAFTPTDLQPLIDAWRSTVGSDPPYTVRVNLDERFVLFLDQPSTWEPAGWPRRFDVIDVSSQPVVPRLSLPDGWRADEIVPGCGYVFRPLRSTLIRAVEPGGTMDRAGLVAGDRIKAIDGTPVATEDEVRERFAAWLGEKKALFAKRREVEITYERAGHIHVARVVPGTWQSPTGFVPALGYETDTESLDVVTPSELVYLALESVRQLAGEMPVAMQALVVPRVPVSVPESDLGFEAGTESVNEGVTEE